MHADLAEFFSMDGPLARELDGYAPRPHQWQMAEAIGETIADYGTLVCEAGTGTGKTFAYLVPALLSGRKVIVSTGTKSLQEQLFDRDLPRVQRAIGFPVTSRLLKGRANYLCPHRLEEYLGSAPDLPPETGRDLRRIRRWAGTTRSGDIAEMAELAEDAPAWRYATSTIDNCLGQECPAIAECFVQKARRAAIEADLVVVNHHLFFADMALKDEGFGELLPSADAVILDEAHQIAEVATRFFGTSLSSHQLLDLFRDIQTAYFQEAGDLPDFLPLVARAGKLSRDLRLALGREGQRVAWQALAGSRQVARTLEDFQQALQVLAEGLGRMAERGRELQNCQRRLADILQRLSLMTGEDRDNYLTWVETHARTFSLNMTPLDVSELFSRRVYGHKCAWVFTSATLAVADSFDHFSRRLGLQQPREGLWQSPFDFRHQALCYLPPGLPTPNTPDYVSRLLEQVRPVLEITRGRAFLLFTSHRALREAAEILRQSLEYPLLVQGDAPRGRLLQQFRETPNGVLLGTGSFWEGIDVRGEALSCVIIDKLPFAAPDDPVLQARYNAIRAQGGNPFMDYQLPQAVIALKQGAGRLIRDVSDRGLLVLCDVRLFTKGYGRVFLESLPPMPRSRELADVRAFFGDAPAEYPNIRV